MVARLSAVLSIEGTVFQSYLPAFRNLDNFFHLTLPVSFGRDTKSRLSLLSGVYAGEVKDPAQGVNMLPVIH